MEGIHRMKVQLVFPQKDGQTGLFIKRAFTDLGCKVKVTDAKVHPRHMLPEAKVFQPDLVFMSRTKILYPAVKDLRRAVPNVVTACWNVDKRNEVNQFPQELLNLFGSVDIMYTIALGNVPQYKKLFPHVVVKHLQQGCDPLTHKIEEPSAADHEKYDCDVMFAGSIGSCGGTSIQVQRKAIIKKMESGIKEEIDKDKFTFKRYGEKHNRITDSPANKAHRCAKIVLGHNGWRGCAVSMSVRDYKIMASGGFLLTEHCRGMESWFELGKMCETYTGADDCVEKVKYYLAHPEERAKIAQYGHDVVHEKHKYYDRIKTVVEDVKKMKRERHRG